MILKISQKVNVNGWRKQAIIDLDKKTIETGSFLFHSSDVEKLTATQYKEMIVYFKNNGFVEV